MNCTSSVINVTGHKDEQLCRILAEKIAAGTQTVTVYTGGFHIDDITAPQIAEVVGAVTDIADELLTVLNTADQTTAQGSSFPSSW